VAHWAIDQCRLISQWRQRLPRSAAATTDVVSTIVAKSASRQAIVTSKIARTGKAASGRSKPVTTARTTAVANPRSVPTRTVELTQNTATVP
jgi:hypothetical protein